MAGGADPGRAVDGEAVYRPSTGAACPVCMPMRTLTRTVRPWVATALAAPRRRPGRPRGHSGTRRRTRRPACRSRSRRACERPAEQALVLVEHLGVFLTELLDSRVDPSMSVKRNVTAPVGRSVIGVSVSPTTRRCHTARAYMPCTSSPGTSRRLLLGRFGGLARRLEAGSPQSRARSGRRSPRGTRSRARGSAGRPTTSTQIAARSSGRRRVIATHVQPTRRCQRAAAARNSAKKSRSGSPSSRTRARPGRGTRTRAREDPGLLGDDVARRPAPDRDRIDERDDRARRARPTTDDSKKARNQKPSAVIVASFVKFATASSPASWSRTASTRARTRRAGEPARASRSGSRKQTSAKTAGIRARARATRCRPNQARERSESESRSARVPSTPRTTRLARSVTAARPKPGRCRRVSRAAARPTRGRAP